MTGTKQTTKLGKTPANGRPLSHADHFYFDNAFAPLSGVFSFSSKGFPKSNAKFQAAFVRALEQSPLLQTQVDSATGNRYFTQIQQKSEWPQLTFSSSVATDDELLQAAQAELDEHVQVFMQGGQEVQRKSFYRYILKRSPHRIAILFCSPHHFTDGTALGSFVVKWCQYVRTHTLRLALWPLVDRLSSKYVPTFWEMGLKQDLPQHPPPRRDEVDATDSNEDEIVDWTSHPRASPKNLSLVQDYYPEFLSHPETASCSCRMDETWIHIPAMALQECRSTLKKKHQLTLTPAMGGLALKVLARLLERSGVIQDHPEYLQQNLLGTNAIDARFLGKWGDARDQRKAFPVVGNYAFSCHKPIPFQQVLDSSLEDVASQIKQAIQTVRDDPATRWGDMNVARVEVPLSSHMYVVCSSVILPPQAKWAGFRNVQFATRIAFGPMPHVWLYLLTCGDTTQLDVDVALPLKGITHDDVRAVLHETLESSALESFLPKRK